MAPSAVDDTNDFARVPEVRDALVAARGLLVHLGDLYTESGQSLQGSFSAVSKPKFASKYSLESSRQDLHNALLLHRSSI